ncbi:MAG: hypothetical protein IPH44_00690 [Myxococcales bacterium]|nr:hypothetical protein [Myxococcales bacterium]MBK7197827.1 hypothetical protein [Myxococcales bacterium]MBP6845757.1 hypothetical protein [Kofleriaceae bacterium]
MHRLLPLAVATVGCAHSYTAISYDLTHRATGTVQTAVPRSGQHSGSVAIGFGTRAAELELVAHGHDMSLSDDPWLAADLGMELKLAPFRRGPVAAFFHGGPMRAVLYDAAAQETSWGAGLAYGLGLEAGVAGLHAFIDVHWIDTLYGGTEMDVTAGRASQRAVSLGLKFGK